MGLSDVFKRMVGKDDEPGIQINLKIPQTPNADGKPDRGPGKERRKSMRVSVRGLEARLHGTERSLAVHDVSVTGAGLVFQGKRVKAGTKFRLTLAKGDAVLVEEIKAKVMRHEQGILGVIWLEPDRHQDEGLHKIVLEAQKLQASLRKGK